MQKGLLVFFDVYHLRASFVSYTLGQGTQTLSFTTTPALPWTAYPFAVNSGASGQSQKTAGPS